MNQDLLEAYSACSNSTDVIKVQTEYLQDREKEWQDKLKVKELDRQGDSFRLDGIEREVSALIPNLNHSATWNAKSKSQKFSSENSEEENSSGEEEEETCSSDEDSSSVNELESDSDYEVVSDKLGNTARVLRSTLSKPSS